MTSRFLGQTALAIAIGIVSLGVALSAIARGIPHSEAAFLQKAAGDSMAEIEIAKLAQQKAAREEVREFARQMAQDHGKVLKDAQSLAAANGVNLPAGPDSKHENLVKKLQGLTGGAFDREYMEHMVRDHKKDLHEARRASRATERDDVTDFAGRVALTIEDHLRMAQKTYDITEAPKRTANRETGSTRR